MSIEPLEFIRSSRSQIVTRHRCRRERLLGYHFGGTGLEAKGGKYEAKFGQILHSLMADCMTYKYWPGASAHRWAAELEDLIRKDFCDLERAHLDHFVEEQRWLLLLLGYGWCTLRMPRILREYEVVSVEQEHTVTFDPNKWVPSNFASFSRPLVLPLRFDVVLRRKADGLLFILDFKTATQASEDWNINLDNSLQSHLYTVGAEMLYSEPIGGISYEGLVKGRRELDKAKSSPYQGQIIQYGSFLYGWRDRNGKVSKEYATGKQRHFMPSKRLVEDVWADLQQAGWNLSSFFPSTMPWKPLNSGFVVAQVIVNENDFTNNLEMWQAAEGPEKLWYEQMLFEQSLDSCFKYGSKHPCQFVPICHEGLCEDEINLRYAAREDHHAFLD
jgi:hypothetical protein